MAWFEHDGVEIYYEETGSGEPVLLLPGFTESIAQHAHMAEALSSSYRVIAADLPGSGRSMPQPRDYTPDYLRRDAHAFAALIEAIVKAPVHVLGFSDGGDIGLLLGVLHPRLVRSILAWGAVGYLGDTATDMIDGFFNVIDRPASGWEAFREHLIAAYGQNVARAMTQGFALNARAILAAGGDISRSLAGSIDCPLLLIVGEHDPFNPSALAEDYARAAPAGRAVTVPGAGHDVHASHPEWFDRTVREWLAGQS